MTQLTDFKIICKKCGSENTSFYCRQGSCDSCGYGQGITVSCNNCQNVEAYDT